MTDGTPSTNPGNPPPAARAERLSLKILVVDDEVNIRKTLALCLEAEGHQVVGVSNPADAKAEAGRRAFDMAFVDLRLGAERGMDLIPQLLSQSPWMKIVVITAYASIDTAVQSMRSGSTDYLPKPFTPAQVRHVAQRIAQTRALEQKIEALQSSAGRIGPEVDVTLTSSPAMQRALHLARQVAVTDATVLIRGESGTGKTSLGRAIHAWSARSTKPLTLVPCPAYSGESMELELFGAAEGDHETAGRIALCEGGTLLLDEIGELPMGIQPKLIRFLQDREYEPVGRKGARRADVRVITTTNASLDELVRTGRFREDLLYRLNVIQIEMPPLRERADDILPLAIRFLSFFQRPRSREPLHFSSAAAELLRQHAWPGNIHELRNVVERSAILTAGSVIGPEHFPAAMAERPPEPPGPGDFITLDSLEEAHIRRVLTGTKSLEEAANVLGIDAATLWRRRKKYKI